MWETLVNGFWIVISGILLAMIISGIIAGVGMALELNAQENARVRPEKELRELEFRGMSRWEVNRIVGKLLREDKRRARRSRYI